MLGDPNQIGNMYPVRMPKLEPTNEPPRTWLAPPTRMPTHSHRKIFHLVLHIIFIIV